MNTFTKVKKIIVYPLERSIRLISSSYKVKPKKPSFDLAIAEAERVIGYPTPFYNVRHLLNDEVTNKVLRIMKLKSLPHPLLNTIRDLFINNQSPHWGLIVLLVSKAARIGKEFAEVDYDTTAGVLHHQKILAKVTEMLKISNIMHKSVLHTNSADPDFNTLIIGNKLSLLKGDYLISKSLEELASLRNNEVFELVMSSLRDLTEAQFIEPRAEQNRPLPALPLKELKYTTIPTNQFDDCISEIMGNAKAEWTFRNHLDGASLLAKSCQGALILAEHKEQFQKLAYLFGRNMALVWQARMDQNIFENDKNEVFSFVCAPLLFHLQYDPSFYDEIVELSRNDTVDYAEIKKIVQTGPGLQKTAKLQEEFSSGALKALEGFPKSEARCALVNIINSI